MAVIRPTGHLSHYGFSAEDQEYLAHYGVKGMKWGKRLKSKITDLSDQYITGKSAKAEMEKHQREADRHATAANAWRQSEERYSNAAKNDQQDYEVFVKAARKSDGSSGRIPMSSGKALKYQNIGENERGQLTRMAVEKQSSAKSNRETADQLSSRRRASEVSARKASAHASAAQQQYEKSLAGKIAKLKSTPLTRTETTLTNLNDGSTIDLSKRRKK